MLGRWRPWWLVHGAPPRLPALPARMEPCVRPSRVELYSRTFSTGESQSAGRSFRGRVATPSRPRRAGSAVAPTRSEGLAPEAVPGDAGRRKTRMRSTHERTKAIMETEHFFDLRGFLVQHEQVLDAHNLAAALSHVARHGWTNRTLFRILLERVHERARKYPSEFGPRQLAFLPHSMARLLPAHRQRPTYQRLAERILRTLAPQAVRCMPEANAVEIATMCWGYATVRVYDSALMHAAVARASTPSHIGAFLGQPHALSNLLWACVRFGHPAPGLLSAALAALRQPHHLVLCPPHTLVSILHSCARLKWRDLTFLSHAAEHLAPALQSGALTLQQTLNLLWSLRTLHFHPPELVLAIVRCFDPAQGGSLETVEFGQLEDVAMGLGKLKALSPTTAEAIATRTLHDVEAHWKQRLKTLTGVAYALSEAGVRAPLLAQEAAELVLRAPGALHVSTIPNVLLGLAFHLDPADCAAVVSNHAIHRRMRHYFGGERRATAHGAAAMAYALGAARVPDPIVLHACVEQMRQRQRTATMIQFEMLMNALVACDITLTTSPTQTHGEVEHQEQHQEPDEGEGEPCPAPATTAAAAINVTVQVLLERTGEFREGLSHTSDEDDEEEDDEVGADGYRRKSGVHLARKFRRGPDLRTRVKTWSSLLWGLACLGLRERPAWQQLLGALQSVTVTSSTDLALRASPTLLPRLRLAITAARVLSGVNVEPLLSARLQQLLSVVYVHVPLREPLFPGSARRGVDELWRLRRRAREEAHQQSGGGHGAGAVDRAMEAAVWAQWVREDPLRAKVVRVFAATVGQTSLEDVAMVGPQSPVSLAWNAGDGVVTLASSRVADQSLSFPRVCVDVISEEEESVWCDDDEHDDPEALWVNPLALHPHFRVIHAILREKQWHVWWVRERVAREWLQSTTTDTGGLVAPTSTEGMAALRAAMQDRWDALVVAEKGQTWTETK